MRKRILVLILSFSTIVAFGYSLGGLGGYLVGQGRPFIAFCGLIIGVLSSILAFRVWGKYLEEIAAEDAKSKETSPREN